MVIVTMVMGVICCYDNVCYHGDGYKYVAMVIYVTMVTDIRFVAKVMYVTMVMSY